MDSALMRACLSAAVAAPSVHNTQPWLFDLRTGAIDVYADPERQLAVIDPAGREMTMSVGAAVFNLRVALRSRGRLPLQLMEAGQPAGGPLVRVVAGAPAAVSRTARELAGAIPRRHTNRWPFANLALPKAVQADLVRAARAEGAALRILGPRSRWATLEVVRAAEQWWQADPAYRQELSRWTLAEPHRRDGVPPGAAGPVPSDDNLPLRDLGLVQQWRRRRDATYERSSTIAVLYGADSPRRWLQAGEAMQRVLLTAAVHGVSATLLTQPLEIPVLRDMVRDPVTGLPAQAIIRLGYHRLPGVATPRRQLADVVRRAEP